ncbi:F-box/LRR-repeat protein At4g14103-like isoform X2 [Henckelia pumila]|uniref:F-box/LRR-repeat protein At4g14103-like isoform X2 n=1 Tax=Henckelia pumila TaxID=405737 RepID=UPI003C6E7313
MSKKPIETVSVVPVVTVDNIGEDIISNLPDNIISHILSLLPAKDALRTCVLSKEWEYKWTCIYNVDIDETRRFSRKRARQKSAVNFIDRILLLAPIPTIKTFRLTCLYKYSPSRLLTWLTAVLMRNAEHVEINYDREGVVLPRCLFHCTSLMILKLQLPCTLRLPPDNWFSNIKILHLARVQFINERVSNTPTFDFPVMERLQLDNCKWFKVNMVEIKAPALTKFNVSHHSGLPKGERCRIKMSGAKHLRCFGLKHLKLAGNVVEGIVVTKQGPPLPEFDMLKRLELFNKCKIGSLLEILHAMPLLETIIFEMLQWDDDIYDEVESLPSCITHHLSSVQFRLFNGKKEHVHMADFWLTNAVGLKKMLGLSRKRSEESQSEENFWTKLKSVFKDGNLMVGSSIKNMADFERFFG